MQWLHDKIVAAIAGNSIVSIVEKLVLSAAGKLIIQQLEAWIAMPPDELPAVLQEVRDFLPLLLAEAKSFFSGLV